MPANRFLARVAREDIAEGQTLIGREMKALSKLLELDVLEILQIAGSLNWEVEQTLEEIDALFAPGGKLRKSAEGAAAKPLRAVERAYLESKYNWSGQRYQDLASAIIEENYATIGERVLGHDKRKFERRLRGMLPKQNRDKQIRLPDGKAIVRRTPAVIKAAEKGKLMTRTMRQKIHREIKSVVLEEGISTRRGRVSLNLKRKARARLRRMFEGYTKNNPRTGMPPNIETIAVTETRSLVNSIRFEYVKRMEKDLKDDFAIQKTWIHNAHLSAKPRQSHRALGGRTVALDGTFRLAGVSVNGPHDPALPAAEFIGCNCELAFKFTPRNKTKKGALALYFPVEAATMEIFSAIA